jgi:hypothetical protein
VVIACLSEETSITPREKEARLRQGSLRVGWGIAHAFRKKWPKKKAMLNQKYRHQVAQALHTMEKIGRSHAIESSPIEDSAEQLKKIHPKDKLFKVGIKSLKE